MVPGRSERAQFHQSRREARHVAIDAEPHDQAARSPARRAAADPNHTQRRADGRGERLFQSLAPRFDQIEADIAALVAFRDKPAGTVRITLSDHALETTVWPKLQPVLRKYPDVLVELYSDNTMRNIVEERFDAGVRFGENIDKDMIAVRIGPDWQLRRRRIARLCE